MIPNKFGANYQRASFCLDKRHVPEEQDKLKPLNPAVGEFAAISCRGLNQSKNQNVFILKDNFWLRYWVLRVMIIRA